MLSQWLYFRTAIQGFHLRPFRLLHRLLSLDSAIEAFDPEQSPCIFLYPDGPEVEQICLLTDGLFDLMIHIAALDELQDKAAMNSKAKDAA